VGYVNWWAGIRTFGECFLREYEFSEGGITFGDKDSAGIFVPKRGIFVPKRDHHHRKFYLCHA